MSVTKEDMAVVFKYVERPSKDSSYDVNDSDMSQFADQDKRLAKKISTIKLKYDAEFCEGKSTRGYDEILDKCQISVTALKKTIKNDIRPSRNLVYKLVVGLKIPLEEANELFALCGGPLTLDCQADKICLYALRDGDSIDHFIEQFEYYTKIKISIRERES